MDYEPRFYLSVPEAACEMHTKPATLREWASRESDPFPIRIAPWNTRQGIVSVADMAAWFERNSKGYR